MADAPIALCEVQGYVYQGKSMLAEVARAIGDGELAGRLEQEADRLRRRFQSAFWCEDLGTYALALDGSKQRSVLASNVGHCLWSGIAAPEHAQRIVETLMGPAFFSGWGIRTIAQGEPLQPDVLSQWFDLAARQRAGGGDGALRPHRRGGEGADRPVRGQPALRTEPPARALLRLPAAQRRRPDAVSGPVPRRPGQRQRPSRCCRHAWGWTWGRTAQRSACTPLLPPFIDWLRIERLGVPGASCDLLLTRHERSVGVDVLRKDAPVSVTVVA